MLIPEICFYSCSKLLTCTIFLYLIIANFDYFDCFKTTISHAHKVAYGNLLNNKKAFSKTLSSNTGNNDSFRINLKTIYN